MTLKLVPCVHVGGAVVEMHIRPVTCVFVLFEFTGTVMPLCGPLKGVLMFHGTLTKTLIGALSASNAHH